MSEPSKFSNDRMKVLVEEILESVSSYAKIIENTNGSVASRELMIIKASIIDNVKRLEANTNILVIDLDKVSGQGRELYEPAMLFEFMNSAYVDTMSPAWSSIVEDSNPKAGDARKGVNWKNFKTAFSALITGEGVSEERQTLRLKVCHQCELFRWNHEKTEASCGVCGCKLGGGSTKLLDLTKFEETDKYGCKHPSGSRWKENDC